MARHVPFVLGVVVALLLAGGCGGAHDVRGAAPGRRVAHEFGTTTAPVAPGRVVALDEAAAMSALAVGVRPAVVHATWGSVVAQTVLTARGVTVVPAAVGPPPPPEVVLADRPDLVLFTSVGDRGPYDALSAAVPTVPLPSTARPWTDTLAAVGDALGRPAEAARLRAVLAGRIDAVRTAAGPARRSVTALLSYAGALAMSAPASPAGAVVTETGLSMTPLPGGTAPPPGAPYALLSPELLPETDADLVLVLGGGVYDSAGVTARPLFAELPAVRAGRSATVLGEPWFATDPFSVWWVATDLEAVLRGRPTGTPGDAAVRFAAFERGAA